MATAWSAFETATQIRAVHGSGSSTDSVSPSSTLIAVPASITYGTPALSSDSTTAATRSGERSIVSGTSDGGGPPPSSGTSAVSQSAQRVKPSRYSVSHSGQNMRGIIDRLRPLQKSARVLLRVNDMKTIALSALLLLLTAACATTDTHMANALPEGDIASIVSTANEGEIQQGNVATSRATSADVRSFAQMMVTDHTRALEEGRTVFTNRGISPAENDTSRTLRNNSQRTVTALGTYNGAEFDRAYMRSQVDLHQWLLTTLDTVLIPSARTAEVRSLLTNQRGSVAAHLEQARAILGRL